MPMFRVVPTVSNVTETSVPTYEPAILIEVEDVVVPNEVNPVAPVCERTNELVYLTILPKFPELSVHNVGIALFSVLNESHITPFVEETMLTGISLSNDALCKISKYR